jgi:hypothetical protein
VAGFQVIMSGRFWVFTEDALYLESLDVLIDRIDEQDSTSVLTRGQWVDRLELWTLKAIEDNSLLVRPVVT